MDRKLRKPFQGVRNIIRFNWHYYASSAALTVVLLTLQRSLNPSFTLAANILVFLIMGTTIISLAVSCYIYDLSGLYTFSWLSHLKKNECIINVNAGFDETSGLLKDKLNPSELIVADFYDPLKHTEISIKRARRVYPPFPGTQQVSTTHLPVQDNTADKVFTIFSAHEIRNGDERIAFFKELQRVLKPSGSIIVIEHLRDRTNFLAYNIGFFHFYPKATWLKTFRLSGLSVAKEIKTTPFITTFILEKNGTAS